MTHSAIHEVARESLGALALDTLDVSERAAVLAHIAGCVTCRGELSGLQRTAGELAYAVSPLPMSPEQRDRVRGRLLERAAAERRPPAPVAVTGSRAATPPQGMSAVYSTRKDVVPIGTIRSRLESMSTSGMMALAASLIAAVSVSLLAVTMRERDNLRDALRTASSVGGSRIVAVDSLKAALEDRDQLIANLTGPQVAVMTLASASPQSPSGRMFWDQAHNAWTFVGHRLQAPRPGRTYQLWLVTRTEKISAGTFRPRENGDVVVRANYALSPDALAAVAITDEPSAGSAQPTTAPFLVAANRTK